MRSRLCVAAAVGVLWSVAQILLAGAALACPEEGDRLLFHSCHDPSAAELLLLPEESDALAQSVEGKVLTVTGGYTGTDMRAEGRPNPVGLFVDNGRVVSPNLARMDGILIIDRDGQPQIHRSTRVPQRDGFADLSDPDQRLDFADRAAENGLSVMQSHLLIGDGKLDIRPQMDAPRARRRLFFSDRHGWGVYQTTEALTLFDAAFELQQRFRPEMAINLDMGSFDYCVVRRNGVAADCGVVDPAETAKLSNLLRFRRAP